nr:unnamed protein product [Callosobruchus chinensis]
MRTGSGADEVYHPKLWYYDLLKFVEDQEVSRQSRSNISDDEESVNEYSVWFLLHEFSGDYFVVFQKIWYSVIHHHQRPCHLFRNRTLKYDSLHQLRLIAPCYENFIIVIVGDDAHMLAVNGPKAMGKVPEFLKALRNAETVNTDAHSPQTEPEIQDSIEKTSSVASGSQFRHRPTPKSQKPDEQSQLTKEVLATVNNHFKRPRTADDRFHIVGKNVAMKLRDLTNDQRRLAEKFINDILFEAEGETLTPHHKLTYQPLMSNRYHSSSTYSSQPSSQLSTSSAPPQQLLLLNSPTSNEHPPNYASSSYPRRPSFPLSATPAPPQQLLLLNSPSPNEYYPNHSSSSNPNRPSSQLSTISSPSQQLLLQNSEASNEHHSQNNMLFSQSESVQEMEPSASPRHYQTASSLLSSFSDADNN